MSACSACLPWRANPSIRACRQILFLGLLDNEIFVTKMRAPMFNIAHIKANALPNVGGEHARANQAPAMGLCALDNGVAMLS